MGELKEAKYNYQSVSTNFPQRIHTTLEWSEK